MTLRGGAPGWLRGLRSWSRIKGGPKTIPWSVADYTAGKLNWDRRAMPTSNLRDSSPLRPCVAWRLLPSFVYAKRARTCVQVRLPRVYGRNCRETCLDRFFDACSAPAPGLLARDGSGRRSGGPARKRSRERVGEHGPTTTVRPTATTKRVVVQAVIGRRRAPHQYLPMRLSRRQNTCEGWEGGRAGAA